MLQTHQGNPECWVEPFCGNSSLWSLSYEWWFYLLYFPTISLIDSKKQKYIVILLSLFGLAVNLFFENPLTHFLQMFPIWWLGVEMAKEYIEKSRITINGQIRYLKLLIIPAAWLLVLNTMWYFDGKPMSFISYPFLDLRYFISTIILFFSALIWQNTHFIGYKSISPMLIFFGSFSYSLYLIHFPIICYVTLLPRKNMMWLDLVLKILISFVLAFIMERLFQKWVNIVCRRFFPEFVK